ncbi:MAG: AAA family ATPase [candidate division Zixibacteria bacterium]|nr:AAA family ATPase [candidate division Zixibacteria bacterium]
MRIIRLRVNNVLNLKAIDIRPDKHINKVSGKNAAGKSNLLETIRFSLLGKRFMPRKPIRKGETKGDVCVELDDYIINVKITPNGEYWLVTDKEGNPVKSPQSLLKDIVGPISFDPLALLDEDPKKLRTVLLELVGVKLDEFDAKIKALRDERTIVGRTRDKSKALLDTCKYNNDAPKQEVSVSELAAELQKANEANNEIQRVGFDIDEAKESIIRLEAQLKEAREQGSQALEYLKTHTIIDTYAITEKMNNVEATNRQVRDNAEFTLRERAFEKEKVEYEDLTAKIETLENDKDKALAAAKMPIPGLGVDEEGVTFTDEKHGTQPITQVNKAKRVEIGTAIHMALNPKLRVMFVDGNAFDDETEAAIETAVRDGDYQLFEEVVDDTSETGIHLVDGTVEE